MSSNSSSPLPVKPIAEAIDEALRMVDYERTGIQNGLYCRFPNLNAAVGKYFRFGKVYLFAGISGHGKSYFLNMLEDDFTDPDLNGNYKKSNTNPIGKKVILLAFKYEMDAKDEILRNVSSDVEKSYSYLLSSEINSETRQYNLIDNFEFEEIKSKTERLKSRNIYYVEIAGNLGQFWNTYIQMKKENPDVDFIVTMDHIMLSAKLGEKDDLELMSNTAHTAIRLRKTGAMVIYLGQLNGNIEDVKRRDSPALHHPVKTDVHCGNQIFWACDGVFIIHRPELLGITKYGKQRLPTGGLMHLAGIKMRGAKTFNIWFEEEFSKGRVKPFFWKLTKATNILSKEYVDSLPKKKV